MLSNIILAQASVGDRVRIYIDEDFGVADEPTSLTLSATVLATRNPYSRDGSISLLGFGSWDGMVPNGVWSAGTKSYESYKSLMGNCTHGCWVDKGIPLKEIISAQAPVSVQVAKPSGMKCAGRNCGTFNEYAEPNVGPLYYCFSCRQRPACMR